jgi:hypothetical protein
LKEIKEVLKQMENQQRAASNDNVSLDPAPNDHAVEAPLSGQASTKKDQPIAQQQDSQDSWGRDIQEGLPSLSVNATKSDETLDHLRILVKFTNEDLEYIWDLRRKFLKGSLQKIAFANLWHLFNYGQEVRTAGNKNLQL